MEGSSSSGLAALGGLSWLSLLLNRFLFSERGTESNQELLYPIGRRKLLPTFNCRALSVAGLTAWEEDAVASGLSASEGDAVARTILELLFHFCRGRSSVSIDTNMPRKAMTSLHSEAVSQSAEVGACGGHEPVCAGNVVRGERG